jgi:glycosyltransferase involved in cell wall biosynthesis
MRPAATVKVGDVVREVNSFLIALDRRPVVCWKGARMDIFISHSQLTRGGGAESYLLDLVGELCAQGDRVHLVLARRDPALVLPAGCTVEIVRAGWVPQKLRPWYLDWQFRKRIAARPGWASVSLARNSGHDMAINGGTHRGFLHAMQRTPSWGDRVQIAIERRAYATARRLVAHSRLVADELCADYGVAKAKIVVFYPAVDRERFRLTLRAQRNDFRARWKLPADKKLILFPSTGHERKGLPLVAEAMRLLPVDRYALVVAGRPAPKLAERVDVVSLGFVDAIEQVYAACDLTVMPSHYEPFGLVYVESALCGTPVIFGEKAGAAEVLPASLGSKLQCRTPEALAELIAQRCDTGEVGAATEIAVPTMAGHVEMFRRVLVDAMRSKGGARCP